METIAAFNDEATADCQSPNLTDPAKPELAVVRGDQADTLWIRTQLMRLRSRARIPLVERTKTSHHLATRPYWGQVVYEEVVKNLGVTLEQPVLGEI